MKLRNCVGATAMLLLWACATDGDGAAEATLETASFDGAATESDSLIQSVVARTNGKSKVERHKRRHDHGGRGCHHDHHHDGDGDGDNQCLLASFGDGLSGANVERAVFDARVPGLAYATQGAGLWRSLDHGASWQPHGAIPSGAIAYLVPDGRAGRGLYAASSEGLLHSADGGLTWVEAALDGLQLTTVEVDPSNPELLYASSSGADVFRSNDGGAHWQSIGANYPYGITLRISVDPRDSRVLLAAVHFLNDAGGFLQDGAVVRSADSGSSWHVALGGRRDVYDLERCPTDPDVLAASTAHGVAVSRDAGASWSFTSLDNGNDWSYGIAFGGASCAEFIALQAQQGPRLTLDGGATFGAAQTAGIDVERVHAYPGRVTHDPEVPGTYLLATHGGLFRSENSGGSWTRTDGIVGINTRSFAEDPRSPGELWLASYGTGTWHMPRGSGTWTRVASTNLPMDYASVVFVTPRTGRVLVGGLGPLFVSSDGTSFAPTGVTGNPFAVVASPSGDVLYAATQGTGVYASHDDGATWSSINGNLVPWVTPVGNFVDVRALAVSRLDDAVLFAAAQGKGLLRTNDSGGTWTSALATPDPVRCVVASDARPGRVYACVDGVKVSEDDGLTWSDTAASGVMDHVTSLVEDEASGTLYATSPQGLFSLDAPGEPWRAAGGTCSRALGSGPALLTTRQGVRTLVLADGGSVYRMPLAP